MKNRHSARLKGTSLFPLLILPLLAACSDGGPADRIAGPAADPQVQGLPEAVAMVPGDRLQLDGLLLSQGEGSYATDTSVGWTTSDDEVVRCMAGGWIEAVQPGEALVTVDFRRGWTAEVRIVVTTERRVAHY